MNNLSKSLLPSPEKGVRDNLNGSYEIFTSKPAVVWGLVQHVGE